MFKKILNGLKRDKSKLTKEELNFIIKFKDKLLIFTFIVGILTSIGFYNKSVEVTLIGASILGIIFFYFMSSDDTAKFVEKKAKLEMKEKEKNEILSIIEKGDIEALYVKDKDLNKLLFDMCLEKKMLEFSKENGNIVVKTPNGINIPFKTENSNEYFGIW